MLAAEQLTFRRNGEHILGPLSLTVHAGELWLVEGANGSGKTTLLRLLAGLLEPGAEEDAPARIERAAPPAFLGHQLGLRAELSALANLRFARALAGAPGLAPSAALAAVGLSGWEERPVAELSAGQRKRVALARLLVAPAPLWLLDEPYANLDGAGAELLNRLLEQQLARDGAAVITAHGPVPWRGPCRRLAL
ncbi:MAG: heme ABC exporter ATP-binding protein CcmA [Xanthomonadales bacterium]|nr:heme ABC exporter ATP-binding protein CcmA [Xanthomonadales bacterium]